MSDEQKPVAWKLVPKRPTEEMLKAMDECSTEGYNERLYAGHAASIYMAAVDVAPSPPQRNDFHPDWDTVAPMVEEQQRMALRIEELETALKNVLPWVVAHEINCHGFNCSHLVCMDCFSNSEEHAEQARQAYRNADEVLERGKV